MKRTPFIRREIGIFYKDISWRDYMYNTLIEECREFLLNTMNGCYKSVIEGIITLGDGSIIRFLPVSKNIRGYRWNEVYIQFIEDEVWPTREDYYCLIKTKIISDIPAYFIKDYEDLCKVSDKLKADDFYPGMETH